MTPSAERARAARLLQAVVVQRRTTDQVLADANAGPLVKELVLGCLRHFFTLSAAVDSALHKPLKPRDEDVRCLMLVGAYQLMYLRVPDHAAVFETVGACGDLGKPWAKGLVNGVLRHMTSADTKVTALATEHSFDHPSWLADMLRREYPDAEALMAADNARAPMALRINVARVAPDDYVGQLDRAGLASRPARHPAGPETRVLEAPCSVAELPGHAEGLVSVQDAGAQFAAGLLAPPPDARVLDACAAPGGKLFHLMERFPGVRITALERDARRLAHLQAEARRLGHRPERLAEGDAAALEWWDGEPFRYVLLDAPCTGTGTLRRHPDIKVLRCPDDVAAMAAVQERLLANLWRVLEPGGTLLYCTCSLLAAENDAVVAGFLERHEDAVPVPLRLDTGRAMRFGWQLLPIDEDTDAFYYARMKKNREP